MHLRFLSDQEILSRTHELIRRERSLTRAVLLHLNEIERRRLHLKHGYASMFDYCTTGLGYSASAAMRRIKTARCLVRFPLVDEMLIANDVNLSTIAQVSDALTDDNHRELLSRIRGKSQREVEAIMAQYQPGSVPRDRVRTIVVRVPSPCVTKSAASSEIGSLTGDARSPGVAPFAMAQTVLASPPCDAACEKSDYCRNGSSALSADGGADAQLEERALLRFSASVVFMAKLEKIKSLAWHRLPVNPSLEQLFEFAMDHFLKTEDPVARRGRRAERKHKTVTRSVESRSPKNPRRVSASVKDDIFERDQGQCTYVSASGRRCASTCAIQVDHVKPVARGGASTAGNLRLLCAYHNRLEAERIFGSHAVRPTRDSSPTPKAPGSSRGRPVPAPT